MFHKGAPEEKAVSLFSRNMHHYHKDLYHNHRRGIVIASIDKMVAAWQLAGATNKAARVETQNALAATADAKTSLSLAHNIQWLHEAERSKSTEGQDPAGE